MADNTKIEWADATVNAVNGCSVLSPGCTNCYAMRLAGTRMKSHPSRAGLTRDSKAGPVWTGEVRLNEKALLDPLRWKRPRRIFWNAHGDPFHKAVPDAWIDRMFASCALTPQHTHMILTKRSARMREYMEPYSQRRADGLGAAVRLLGYQGPLESLPTWPLRNVCLGVSVEDQARADERIPDLLATPAAVRFISAEPLLGPVDLKRFAPRDRYYMTRCEHCGWTGSSECCDLDRGWDDADVVCPACHRTIMADEYDDKLDWVIVGGESGPGARPMQNDWAQSLVDQCKAAGVAVFVKQLSSGGPRAIKDLDAFPEGLRVRELPNAR